MCHNSTVQIPTLVYLYNWGWCVTTPLSKYPHWCIYITETDVPHRHCPHPNTLVSITRTAVPRNYCPHPLTSVSIAESDMLQHQNTWCPHLHISVSAAESDMPKHHCYHPYTSVSIAESVMPQHCNTTVPFSTPMCLQLNLTCQNTTVVILTPVCLLQHHCPHPHTSVSIAQSGICSVCSWDLCASISLSIYAHKCVEGGGGGGGT